MSSKTSADGESIRLLFEMTRDDNPRLYDDLLRFRKGTKRVNRLRLLAHEGLIGLQQTSAGHGSAGLSQSSRAALQEGARETRLADARQTNQVFGLQGAGEAG